MTPGVSKPQVFGDLLTSGPVIPKSSDGKSIVRDGFKNEAERMQREFAHLLQMGILEEGCHGCVVVAWVLQLLPSYGVGA
jgi:hypothetical protein